MIVLVVGLTISEAEAKKKWYKRGTLGKIVKEAERAPGNVQEGAKQFEKEALRPIGEEAQRVERKTRAELGRFGERTEAEWGRFDKRVDAEMDRTGDAIEAEWRRVDDNLKKALESPIEEWKRFKEKAQAEIDRQQDVFTDMAKGKVCGAYNKAQKSDSYNVPALMDSLKVEVENLIRPLVTATVQLVATPLQSIPYVGSVLYALATSQAPEPLTKNAARNAIKTALKRCDADVQLPPVPTPSATDIANQIVQQTAQPQPTSLPEGPIGGSGIGESPQY